MWCHWFSVHTLSATLIVSVSYYWTQSPDWSSWLIIGLFIFDMDASTARYKVWLGASLPKANALPPWPIDGPWLPLDQRSCSQAQFLS